MLLALTTAADVADVGRTTGAGSLGFVTVVLLSRRRLPPRGLANACAPVPRPRPRPPLPLETGLGVEIPALHMYETSRSR